MDGGEEQVLQFLHWCLSQGAHAFCWLVSCGWHELERLAEPNEKSGVFFAQSAFGMMGSFMVSPKIRNLVVSDTANKIKELVTDIQAEIVHIRALRTSDDSLRNLVADTFNQRLDAVKKQLKKLRFWITVIQTSTWLVILGGLGASVHVLHTGQAPQYGVFLLLFFLPFPCIRFCHQLLHAHVESAYKQESSAFERAKNAAQSMYRREILDASQAFKKRRAAREAS